MIAQQPARCASSRARAGGRASSTRRRDLHGRPDARARGDVRVHGRAVVPSASASGAPAARASRSAPARSAARRRAQRGRRHAALRPDELVRSRRRSRSPRSHDTLAEGTRVIDIQHTLVQGASPDDGGAYDNLVVPGVTRRRRRRRLGRRRPVAGRPGHAAAPTTACWSPRTSPAARIRARCRTRRLPGHPHPPADRRQ